MAFKLHRTAAGLVVAAALTAGGAAAAHADTGTTTTADPTATTTSTSTTDTSGTATTTDPTSGTTSTTDTTAAPAPGPGDLSGVYVDSYDPTLFGTGTTTTTTTTTTTDPAPAPAPALTAADVAAAKAAFDQARADAVASVKDLLAQEQAQEQALQTDAKSSKAAKADSIDALQALKAQFASELQALREPNTASVDAAKANFQNLAAQYLALYGVSWDGSDTSTDGGTAAS